MRLKTINLIVLGVALFGASQIHGQSKADLKIEGQVLSRNNDVIAGVLVRAYRDERLLPNPVRTDKNGYYSFSFQMGDRISLIRYDLTGWYPGKLESLSGAKDHRVNKVLIKFGESLSSNDRLEIGSTFSRLVALDLANGSSPDQFKAFYNPAIVAAFRNEDSLSWAREDPNWAWFEPGKAKFIYGRDRMPAYLDIQRGEALRLDQKTLRITFEGNSHLGKPTAVLVRDGDTLHVWAISARSQSESSEPYRLTQQYEDASEIQHVIFHGIAADLNVKITAGG